MTEKEKLEELIAEIDNLVNHAVTTSTPAFRAWKTDAERFLIKRFGDDSFEHKDFVRASYRPGIYTSHQELVGACKNGLIATKIVFESYLKEMNTDLCKGSLREDTCCMDKVFVVHGHDGELKHAVARIVEKQGIEAIILSEKANKGKTIIEKFEENSDVGGAICLFTADDFGRAKADSLDSVRARQNVVLETGYFMGKLGRNHVVLLADKGIEMPSDLSGVVYTNTANWQFDVLKELNAMGYKVDLNKLL